MHFLGHFAAYCRILACILTFVIHEICVVCTKLLFILTISFLLIGFSTTLIGIGTQTLIQLNVEETYRARVLTWWSTISFGSLSLGGIFIGLCGEYIPLTMAMLMISIIGCLFSWYFSKFSF